MSDKNTEVFGIYPSYASLESGVDSLKATGFSNRDISVLPESNTAAQSVHSESPTGPDLRREKNLCWLTASTAASKSLAASDFTTYPLAPALNASRIICAESCCVTIKTSDFGSLFRIRRQASSPSIFGMLTSSTTTSGFRRSALSTA